MAELPGEVRVMGERGWLSIAEATELVGATDETIRIWIAKGRVQAEKAGNRWFVEPESLFAAAGMPYMQIVYDLRREIGMLKQRVAGMEQELRDLRAREQTQEREIARLRSLLEEDDFTSKAGIARFFVRHGMSYHTLLHYASSDPLFPVNQPPHAIIAYVRQLAQQSQQRPRGRKLAIPHQCDIPACSCHTMDSPLPVPTH
jgi:excisionase family DNA binding protein